MAKTLIEQYSKAKIRDLIVQLVEQIDGIVITGPADKMNDELHFEAGKVVITSDSEPMILVRPDD